MPGPASPAIFAQIVTATRKAKVAGRRMDSSSTSILVTFERAVGDLDHAAAVRGLSEELAEPDQLDCDVAVARGSDQPQPPEVAHRARDGFPPHADHLRKVGVGKVVGQFSEGRDAFEGSHKAEQL